MLSILECENASFSIVRSSEFSGISIVVRLSQYEKHNLLILVKRGGRIILEKFNLENAPSSIVFTYESGANSTDRRFTVSANARFKIEVTTYS